MAQDMGGGRDDLEQPGAAQAGRLGRRDAIESRVERKTGP